MPGDASGGLDGVQRKPLTADFHEPGFVATLNGENALGFWFQLSGDDRRQAGVPWGPANPQALNRYSYVLNAPVKATDPSGHLEEINVNLFYRGWGYSTVVGNDPNATYYDQTGNRLYRDPDTGVLYRKINGNKERLMRVHYSYHGKWVYKYVYENDAEFKDYKAHVDAAKSAWDNVGRDTEMSALGGCVGGALGGGIGCIPAGALGAVGGFVGSTAWAIGAEESEYQAAYNSMRKIEDVGAPQARTHR